MVETEHNHFVYLRDALIQNMTAYTTVGVIVPHQSNYTSRLLGHIDSTVVGRASVVQVELLDMFVNDCGAVAAR